MEAQVEYSNLLRDFPSSDFCETAQFKLAECSKEQIHNIDRDQSKTTAAIDDYNTFLNNYPESALADSARNQINYLRTLLAKKELKIANHYLKMGEPQAAAIYYKSILKDYPSQINIKEIHLNLTQCYIAMNQFKEAESYLENFKDLDPKDAFFPRVQRINQKLNKKKSKTHKNKSGKDQTR
jgi:outer membrane protein assembly factor BamD